MSSYVKTLKKPKIDLNQIEWYWAWVWFKKVDIRFKLKLDDLKNDRLELELLTWKITIKPYNYHYLLLYLKFCFKFYVKILKPEGPL